MFGVQSALYWVMCVFTDRYKRTTESNLCIPDYFHHLTPSLVLVLTSFVQKKKKKSALKGAVSKQYRLQPDVPSDL